MCFHYYLQSYWFLNVCGCSFDGAYYVLSLLFTKLLVSKCVWLFLCMEPTMCFHYYLQSYWFLNVCGCSFDGAYYVLSLLFTKLLVSKCVWLFL